MTLLTLLNTHLDRKRLNYLQTTGSCNDNRTVMVKMSSSYNIFKMGIARNNLNKYAICCTFQNVSKVFYVTFLISRIFNYIHKNGTIFLKICFNETPKGKHV